MDCSFVLEGIDHDDAVIAHDETSICASVALGVVNRRPDVRADEFHLEWRLGVRSLRQNCSRRNTEKKRKAEEESHRQYRTASRAMRKVREICDEKPPGKSQGAVLGCDPNSPNAIFVERHADGGVHTELFKSPDFGE